MAKFRTGDIPQFKDVNDVASYLYQMQEQLGYILNHLETDNLTEDTLNTLTAQKTLADLNGMPADTKINGLDGVLNVSSGGTGRSELTENKLLYGAGTEIPYSLGFPSVAGSFLRQNTDGAPYFSSPKDTNKILGQNGLGSFYSAWGNYGRIIDTNYTFSYYANTVITLISPTSVMIKMSGKMGTNYNSASYYQYGISTLMLNSQISSLLSSLGYTLNTVTYLPKSQWLSWKFTDGTLICSNMEYGTCFEVDTTDKVLRPARIYNTSGAVGGWGIGTWYAGGFYFDTTIFATVTLA